MMHKDFSIVVLQLFAIYLLSICFCDSHISVIFIKKFIILGEISTFFPEKRRNNW